MKRAMINLHISIHDMKGNELRDVVPAERMKENNLPINTTICFDGEDEYFLMKRLREWLEQGGNPRIPPKN
jgi:hypothetical protein